MQTILFLCTGNSCRSQMAEGWAKSLWGKEYAFYSAGIITHGVNPRAVKVMQEVGIDLSGHTSKTVESLSSIHFDIVFTLCGHAQDHCPIFTGNAHVKHMGFDDPPKLTEGMRNEEEILAIYRRIRDEIGLWIKNIKDHL